MKRKMYHTICYLMKVLWQFDKKQFFRMILHIITGAITPFIAVILPSIIIYQLLHEVTMTSFVLVSGGVCLGYGILLGLYGYIREYNKLGFVALRGSVFMSMAYKSRMKLDYAMLEDEAKRKMLEEAIEATDRNIDGVEGMYHDFIEFAMALLGLVLYAIGSSGLNLWLTLALFVLVIVEYGCFTYAKRYELSHLDELDGYLIRVNYLNKIAYDDASAKDIRLYQLQHWIDHKFEEVNRLLTHIKRKDHSAYMAVDTITIVLDFLRDICCYGYLIYQLTQGLPIDQFVFYLGIISGFSVWFKTVGESYARLSSNHIQVNRMLDALELSNVMHHGTGKAIQGDTITITFDHVCFHYPNQTRMILDDVSFTIQAGQNMALIGSNGAGKSTIVKLILGFYLPVKGRVLINGVDTRDVDVDTIYEHMAGIFQDSAMISYTIAENISMCSLEDTDMQRVIACLKQAELWDVVSKLPNKEKTFYHKDIQPDGIQLSGGQLQKLFMARVLYHGANCLLLDEPTAALDALAEKALYERYETLTQGKTSLFISHRLSSTKFCDTILVLDQGKIAEQGSHEDLLAKQGIYAHMFEAQAKYYQEDEQHEHLD